MFNGLDPDQGPDLGQNCLQKLPAYNKSPSWQGKSKFTQILMLNVFVHWIQNS